MNEDILYTLAGVAVTIAGFSGVVVVLPLRDSPNWSPTEIRMLRLLIADSFVALFLALLPIPLSLANWSPDATFRKIRDSQTIGVAPLHSGSGVLQTTFSAVLQRSGRCCS